VSSRKWWGRGVLGGGEEEPVCGGDVVGKLRFEKRCHMMAILYSIFARYVIELITTHS